VGRPPRGDGHRRTAHAPLWLRAHDRLGAAAAVLGILTPLAGGLPLLAAAFLFIPRLFGDGLATIGTIDELTVRQQVTPRRLLGRVNATLHVLQEGVGPIGALAGALLAEAFGIRTAIWISVAGSFAGIAFLIFSPLRSLRAVAGPRGSPGTGQSLTNKY
jgi:hypothetical protein